jgi:hypothetical protein
MESFEFDLDYDPSLIHAVGVTEGDIFAGFTTFFNVGSIDNTAGYLDNVFGLITDEGNVSDAGYLANITFTAQSLADTSPLLLVDVGVTNESAYLSIEVVNGSVTVEAGGDVTPPEISSVSMVMSDPADTDIGWVNISCLVTDNVGVDEVWLNLTYPDLHVANLSMTAGSGDLFYVNASLSVVGSYSYFIWANDTSDNRDVSAVDGFELPPNWDINVDHDCSIVDLVFVAGHFDETGVNGWIREDVNNDGDVSIVDLVLVSGHFDETW